jgi:hypothetical protein
MTEGLPFGIEWPFASMQSDRQRFRHVSFRRQWRRAVARRAVIRKIEVDLTD